ncbi:MAG: hypothetical protein ACFE9Z_01070 [Promethearchaeota archaeon]
MQFFSVTENGALRRANKVDFNVKKVFLIDDIKTIYLWYGLNASQKKKDLSLQRAEKLKEQRKKSTKIEILNQNQEYGSFLAIMDILKEGIIQNHVIERRPELKIKFLNTVELIDAGIDPDFEAEITLEAHKLSQKNYSYEELCRKLAELQLTFLKGKSKASEKDIKKKYEEIYKSSSTYDELCWLISEMSKFIQKKL